MVSLKQELKKEETPFCVLEINLYHKIIRFLLMPYAVCE